MKRFSGIRMASVGGLRRANLVTTHFIWSFPRRLFPLNSIEGSGLQVKEFCQNYKMGQASVETHCLGVL